MVEPVDLVNWQKPESGEWRYFAKRGFCTYHFPDPGHGGKLLPDVEYTIRTGEETLVIMTE